MSKPPDNEPKTLFELQRRRSGSGPVLGSGTSADSPRLPSLHPSDEPSTYFEIEQRRLDNPGEDKVGVVTMPQLPPTSPWAGDPVPDEPLIDRSEDSDFIQPEGE
jgi:hypothetical protein